MSFLILFKYILLHISISCIFTPKSKHFKSMSKKQVEEAANHRKMHGHDKYPNKTNRGFLWKVLVIIVIFIALLALFAPGFMENIGR